MEQEEQNQQRAKIRKGVFKQFQATKCNQIDMIKDEKDQLPFILKSLRIEYLFESIKQMRENIMK